MNDFVKENNYRSAVTQGEWEIALDQAKNMTTPFRLHVTYKTQNAEQQQQENSYNHPNETNKGHLQI